jgi:hypothetical protein
VSEGLVGGLEAGTEEEEAGLVGGLGGRGGRKGKTKEEQEKIEQQVFK